MTWDALIDNSPMVFTSELYVFRGIEYHIISRSKYQRLGGLGECFFWPNNQGIYLGYEYSPAQ